MVDDGVFERKLILANICHLVLQACVTNCTGFDSAPRKEGASKYRTIVSGENCRSQCIVKMANLLPVLFSYSNLAPNFRLYSIGQLEIAETFHRLSRLFFYTFQELSIPLSFCAIWCRWRLFLLRRPKDCYIRSKKKEILWILISIF